MHLLKKELIQAFSWCFSCELGSHITRIQKMDWFAIGAYTAAIQVRDLCIDQMVRRRDERLFLQTDRQTDRYGAK
jgi:hypothetical protein